MNVWLLATLDPEGANYYSLHNTDGEAEQALLEYVSANWLEEDMGAFEDFTDAEAIRKYFHCNGAWGESWDIREIELPENTNEN